ncbi:hypothetical protein CNR34_00112 [Pseudomonas phage nickie]|uniref:Uncharacterized protein n=1 Tax=Pseudomonas phage nickie TaxID=2048977 RepID=A0A2H4P796_9CAUD|nr:hypothetical protein FDJ16_gp053 [Pseudomonas phage nickie]ATW58045.1 hypothetical protein CNR34_00112 [Pseudomonas phage nickie]
MIWLHRLRNLPMLLVLHLKHSNQFMKVEDAQLDLYAACTSMPGEIEIHAQLTRTLEAELETMADIDERIEKLWHR